jgi:hypothetical protein
VESSSDVVDLHKGRVGCVRSELGPEISHLNSSITGCQVQVQGESLRESLLHDSAQDVLAVYLLVERASIKEGVIADVLIEHHG